MRSIFFSIFLFLLSIPGMTQAAALSFKIEASTSSDEYIGHAVLDAPVAINTVEVVVVIPSSVRVQQILQENPLGFVWIEAPLYSSSARTIHFSGIRPGGWKGNGGELVSFRFSAPASDISGLKYNPHQTRVYLNDGQGSEEPVVFKPAALESSSWTSMYRLLVLSGLLVLISAVYWIHTRLRITYR